MVSPAPNHGTFKPRVSIYDKISRGSLFRFDVPLFELGMINDESNHLLVVSSWGNR